MNKFRPVAWQAKVTLFQSQCSSLYGCHLWRLDDPAVNELCTTWKVCSRKILGLNKQTRSYLLPHIMGTLPIQDIIMSRMLNFFVIGLNHDSNIISDFFKNTLISNSSYMLTNVNTILEKFKIHYHDLFNLQKSHIKKIIKNFNDEPDWRSNLVKELLCMREKQCSSNFSIDQINDTLYYVSTYR